MGIALFPPEDGHSLGADCFTKNGLEGGRVGSISFKGRGLERGRIGSFRFKHRKLETIGSISFKGTDLRAATIGSISFNGRNLEKATTGSIRFKATIGSISFKGRDLERATVGSVSFQGNDLEAGSTRSNICNGSVCAPVSMGSDSPKEEAAALKLQKVYRSYRTRRNLADCAVVVEELWWKAIDFVTLKRSTVSFFDIDKPETAISRWSRARIKAAKVGKGLSKDDKARKLAFQHWLEAIDPRHGYGHNLHFYYDAWFETDTAQPFFYWLDVGDGRDLNLDDCARLKMQQQCIKYLGPKEREQYEVVVEHGKLVYKHSGQLVDTCKGSKWIFVLSTLKALYVGEKRKGTFQHSSLLAGGAISAAGRLVVEGGVLKSIWPYSGHYLPTEENFNEFINFLEENNIDLTNVQKSPSDEDEASVPLGKDPIIASGTNSEVEKEKHHSCKKMEENDLSKECTGSHAFFQETKTGSVLGSDVKDESEDQTGNNFIAQQWQWMGLNENENENERHMPLTEALPMEMEGSDTEEVEKTKTAERQRDQEQACYKKSLSLSDKDLDNQLMDVPHKSLLQRLHSKKSLQSYQPGKQLSIKWSTGAGPRIVCVADYPSELRLKALEKVNLSPTCISLNNTPRDSGSLNLPNQLMSPKFHGNLACISNNVM